MVNYMHQMIICDFSLRLSRVRILGSFVFFVGIGFFRNLEYLVRLRLRLGLLLGICIFKATVDLSFLVKISEVFLNFG